MNKRWPCTRARRSPTAWSAHQDRARTLVRWIEIPFSWSDSDNLLVDVVNVVCIIGRRPLGRDDTCCPGWLDNWTIPTCCYLRATLADPWWLWTKALLTWSGWSVGAMAVLRSSFTLNIFYFIASFSPPFVSTRIQSGAPGVYSRVTDQLDWVRGQTQGQLCSRSWRQTDQCDHAGDQLVHTLTKLVDVLNSDNFKVLLFQT